MNKFLKTLSFLLITLILTLLVGRNFLLTGTFLILFRWFLIAFSFLFIYISRKNNFITLRKYLIVSLSLLILETAYNNIQFIHFNTIKTTTPISFKIMSYNLYFKNPNKLQSYNLFKNEKIDVFCLQEITPSWNTFLENRLGNKYKVLKPLRGTHGISIYSKYPIKLLKYFYNSNHLPYAQLVEINIKGSKVLICNTHLASPAKAVEHPDKFLEYYLENYNLRVKQYQNIEKYISSKKEIYNKVVMIGDMNTTQLEPLYRDMKYDWTNSSNNCLDFSFPNSSKVPSIFNLDYIFTKGNFSSKDYTILRGGSSDHLAIISTLTF